MSDPKKEDKKEDAAAKPKGKGKLLTIVAIVLAVAISSVAGAALSPIIGPRFAGAAPAPPKPPKAHAATKEDGEPAEEDEEEEVEGDKKKGEPKGLVTLESAVVDLRDASNETHHLKIGVAIEITSELPEEEGKIFVVRARDAEITYLRTLSYEDVTDHAKFESIRKELSVRIIKAFGKKRAKRMLITEYVVQ